LPDQPTAAVHGPYEDLAIALVGLIGKVIDGQPPEVRAELWKIYVEDVKAWREFWGRVSR
jgi:hypothetical protein